MKTLGIIPARGGSKGVRKKNIRLIEGRPLISYSIDCAKESTKLTEFVVNTDDAEIAAIVSENDANVIIRPPELGTDNAPVLAVIKQTLEFLRIEKEKEFDLIILLQVTSPLRKGSDIDRVVGMFENDPSLEGVISVVPMYDIHPARMYDINENGWLSPLMKTNETANRQKLQPVYYRNGCIYAVKPEAMYRENTLMVSNKKAYVMSAEWLANIDDERDFIVTETLLKLWKDENSYCGSRRIQPPGTSNV